MKAKCLPMSPTIALVAWASLASFLPAPAIAQSMQLPAGQFVNVNAAFNTSVQLTDVNPETLASAQQAGRKYIYNMVSKECAVLKATIAKTCRLTNLNVSAQLRERKNVPASLYLNGNAQFAITLKEEDPG